VVALSGETHEKEAEEGMEQSRGFVRVNRDENGDDGLKRGPSHSVSVSNFGANGRRFQEDRALVANPTSNS